LLVTTEFLVQRLGAAGDGVADGPVHIARTLPGERVRATKIGAQRAALDEILLASPHRISPSCRHFADCGGCAVQHLEDSAYAEWKRGLVAHALARAGFDASCLAPLVRTAPGTRRRMDFAARRVPGGIHFGLHAQQSETIIDIAACPCCIPRWGACSIRCAPCCARSTPCARNAMSLRICMKAAPICCCASMPRRTP
jgi:23S rRNA (uracil1939-C5)-methyltransferase